MTAERNNTETHFKYPNSNIVLLSYDTLSRQEQTEQDFQTCPSRLSMYFFFFPHAEIYDI